VYREHIIVIKKFFKSDSGKKLAGFLKIGFVSSLFYASTSGACPCCGAPASTCGTSLSIAGLAGLLSTGFYYGLGGISAVGKKFAAFLKCKLHRT